MKQNLFIEKLPKAELHLHIEGCLEPELMFELADRNKLNLPYKNMKAIKAAYQFSDLQSFLNIYYQSASVLIHEQDFYDLTWAYLKRCQQQNVVHVEIFFDPQTHTNRGISIDTVVTGITQALSDGEVQLGISSHLIFCLLRDLPVTAAQATLQALLPYRDQLLGMGLDSAEIGHPPSKFETIFAQARKAGWVTVAHAGEEGSAAYIWDAINTLHVSRIDHGIRCTEDETLMQYLAETQLPLTVCPLSNVCLRTVPNMAQHPIKYLLERGLCVTINSDDPAYFGGYINENYLAVTEKLNLTDQQLAQLAIHSFTASFLVPSRKQHYIRRIEQLIGH